MSKPQISARIPVTWHEELQSICDQTGQTMSEVTQAAIAAYLGRTDVRAVSSLSKRVSALERQYKKLVNLV
jgi:predicted DNA-binding protein